jgi:uncharacterized protein YecT (DUF1311 family)
MARARHHRQHRQHHHLSLVALIISCLLGIATQARADCDQPKDDAERAQCLGEQLTTADSTINTVYQKLMGTLTATEKTQLRTAQRDWLKRRDAECGLTWSRGSRQTWLQDLLRDYQKTVCVVRLTDERVNDLTHYSSTPPTPAAPAASAPTPTAVEPAGDDVYDMFSSMTRQSGKWYYEVRIHVGQVAKSAEASLFIGTTASTAGHDGSGVGTLLSIRRKDTSEPAT